MNIEKLGITPGPWKIDKCRNYCGSEYCTREWPGPGNWVQGSGYEPEDAMVVAAAPEMLEVLIETAEYQELSHGGVDCIIQDAIENATGRTWEEVRSIVYESV